MRERERNARLHRARRRSYVWRPLVLVEHFKFQAMLVEHLTDGSKEG